MVSILLTHWAVYLYIPYVLVLVILFVIFRPRRGTFYKPTHPFRPRTPSTPSRSPLREKLR